MKKDNVTPTIGIVILVFAIAFSAAKGKASSSNTAPALPVVTSELQFMTVDELHARIKRVLDETSQGNYSIDVDKENGTITINMWNVGLGVSELNLALYKKEYLDKWNKNTAGLVDLCNDVQAQVSNHGHPEYTVTVRLLNPDDFGQFFAVAEHGELLYDIVDATPPGQEIIDGTLQASSAGTGATAANSPNINYIVNLDSKIFHKSDCPSASIVSDSNRAVFNGDRLDLLAQGYAPCERCNP